MTLTEEEWALFETYCRTLDFGVSEEEEVVFRGGKTYSLEYARKPAIDAQVLASELEKNPQKYNDAGFLTILPFAKSVELHWRMLYLGTSETAMLNSSFRLSPALRSIEKSLKTGSFDGLRHQGFNNKEVHATDGLRGRLASMYNTDQAEIDSVCKKLFRISYTIYHAGNKFRHNEIKPWAEIANEFRKLSKEFTKFEKEFATLYGV